MWSTVFGAVNLLAMLCWAALILAPRHKLVETLVLYLGIGLLCLAYALLLVLLLTGAVNGGEGDGSGASFTSIAGVQGIFATEGGTVVGWTHYLALDLFAGLWIAKDADAKGFSRLVQAPVLLLTFMAGPAGLLVWLIVRERRARAAARSAGRR